MPWRSWSPVARSRTRGRACASPLTRSRSTRRSSALPRSPPALAELRQELSAAGNGSAVLIDDELLAALAHRREIVRVSDDLAFAAPAYDRMVEQIVMHLKSHGKITVAEVRDLFGT